MSLIYEKFIGKYIPEKDVHTENEAVETLKKHFILLVSCL